MKTFALIFAASTSFAAEKKATPPCCRVGLPPGKPSDKSVYKLGGKWVSDLGNEVTLDVSRGHPVVMAMVFTNCQHSCPTIVADMKAIESKLPAAVRAKTDFMLISIDPDRDSALLAVICVSRDHTQAEPSTPNRDRAIQPEKHTSTSEPWARARSL